MKKFLTSVAMALLLVGCAKEYDDSGLKERVSALETRVTALESNVQALQSAIGEGVFVAKVQEYVDPDTGKTIGVTVTYTNGDVKYFEITPQEDYDGPVLGVIKSGSGELVWAIDGIAILIDGKEVPVYQTPVFTLDEDGFLWVEVNGEKVKLGQVQNEGATLVDGIFTNIKVEQDKIVLTLSDETTVNIPFAEAFKIELMLDSCVYTAMEPIPVHYAITAATAGTVVRVAGYSPLDFVVAVNAEDKIIEITPLHPTAAAQFLVVADSGIGLVSTATLQVEPEGMTIVDVPYSVDVDYMAEGENGSVSAHIVSNIVPEVKPVDEWIHLVDVKATAYTITLSLDDNKTGEVRTGTVNILKKGTDMVIQTLTIGQLASEIEEGPANLSKKESANTYIVTAAGDYKFAAVKGNSTESVGAVSKAEILWETEYTESAPAANSIIASVAYADGVIYFSTPAELKPGAAVIVAKDESDAILWNWLIWIPETPITHIDNAAFYGLPVMDRNLGALKAATTSAAGRETYGMYYQWGRNNPLPGFAKATVDMTKEDGPKSTAYAIANPTVFIKVSESDSAGNWNEEDLADLWEDAEGKKAMFDPCPPGYKVPSFNSETALWAGNNDGWTYTWDANNYSYGDIVFPMAGWYSSSASVGYEKERSIILSATAHSTPRARLKIIRKDKSGFYYANYFKQEAASVRCVVVNESAIVPPTPNPEPDKTIDLSEKASANCYVVSAAGDYKFKAVKGNSGDSVGAFVSAETLWETVNTATAPEFNTVIAQVGINGEYITFSTPESLVPGNALIAAKDEAGTILWSWHIWIPATEIVTQSNAELVSKDIMDRDLGALDAAPVASALRYQWGRKDPLVPVDFGATVALTKVSRDPDNIGIEYAIQHPTEYIKGSENSGKGNWCKDPAENLWNDTEGKKTIYDPCPAGYRVPVGNTASGEKLWVSSDAGWTAGSGSVAFGEIVFPYNGYLESSGDAGTNLYHASDRTMVWSATYDSVDKATVAYLRGDKVYSTSYYQYIGANVRCVKE